MYDILLNFLFDIPSINLKRTLQFNDILRFKMQCRINPEFNEV